VGTSPRTSLGHYLSDLGKLLWLLVADVMQAGIFFVWDLATGGSPVPPWIWVPLLAIGLVVFPFIAYHRLYRRVEELKKPPLAVTVELPESSRFGNLEGNKMIYLRNVWVVNHSSRVMLLEFELTLVDDVSPQPGTLVLGKDPYQEIFRRNEPVLSTEYFSNPLHLDAFENRRRNLAFVTSRLVPDQALAQFSLKVREVHSGNEWTVESLGRHNLQEGK
jgi:hypothetical protein